jgi:hypothetical protein
LLATVCGVAVGTVVASVLVASGSLDGRATAVPPAPAGPAFLAAFQHSLTGTYRVDGTFTRRIEETGRTLTSGASRVQAPPDHLDREFGGVNGAIGGHVIGCSTARGNAYICSPTSTKENWSSYVSTAMGAMRAYLDPRHPLYTVVAAGTDCFDLTQVGRMAIAPYGIAAHMCFDKDTGAMTYLREQLDGPPDATDTFAATHITGAVSPSDFSLGRDTADSSTYHNGPP